MSRTQRLLQLSDLLRRSRRPLPAQEMAAELQISVRTVYRDIALLRAQGADIRGEAGVGFEWRGGWLMPPAAFGQDELAALLLGLRWAARQGGAGEAARSALEKIRALIPPAAAAELENMALYPLADTGCTPQEAQVLEHIRAALGSGCYLCFDYTDAEGRASRRQVQPVAVGYFGDRGVRLLAAWCCLRGDFRHFRCDRIGRIETGLAAATPHRLLLQRWREQDCGGGLVDFDF